VVPPPEVKARGLERKNEPKPKPKHINDLQEICRSHQNSMAGDKIAVAGMSPIREKSTGNCRN
jgi:hypothetical protein